MSQQASNMDHVQEDDNAVTKIFSGITLAEDRE